MPCHHDDDFGVSVTTGEPAKHRLRVPVSAGLYGDIDIARIDRLALDESVTLTGPGIIAFDGDRLVKLGANDQATVTVRRDGPWLIDPAAVLEAAAKRGLLIADS